MKESEIRQNVLFRSGTVQPSGFLQRPGDFTAGISGCKIKKRMSHTNNLFCDPYRIQIPKGRDRHCDFSTGIYMGKKKATLADGFLLVTPTGFKPVAFRTGI